MKLIIYHAHYGCDTGCCGHIIMNVQTSETEFEFAHPYYEDSHTFAENLIRNKYGEDHVKDLDWERCIILND